MTVVLYLLVTSLLLGACGLAVFMWSLRSGQYEDMEGAANRILFDDPAPSRAPAHQAQTVRPAGGDQR